MKQLIYIVVTFLSFFCAAQDTKVFEQANTLYNEGKYNEALEKYTAILEGGYHSASLYFNMGNAHYKLNNIAPSIYYYEKALQLAPNDAEINNNIAFARNMTIDAVEVMPETGLSKFVNNISNTFTFDGWAKLAIAMVFCFVVLFVVYYFAYSSLKKRLAFIGSLTALLLSFLVLAFAFRKYDLDKKDKPAIIFAKESKIKSEPNQRGEEAFLLHEGTKVQVLDSVGEWRKVKLADGKTGWILSDDIKMLNDF